MISGFSLEDLTSGLFLRSFCLSLRDDQTNAGDSHGCPSGSFDGKAPDFAALHSLPRPLILWLALRLTLLPFVFFQLSMFSRWIIWMTIPLRIVWELYQCLYPPNELVEESKQQNGQNGEHVAAKGKDRSVAKEQAQFWKETAEQDQWWSPNGTMTALKRFNTVRLRLVAESYLKHTLGLEATWEDSFRDALPLSGARICDVGCGGGILTEALAKRGATVVGIGKLPCSRPPCFESVFPLIHSAGCNPRLFLP